MRTCIIRTKLLYQISWIDDHLKGSMSNKVFTYIIHNSVQSTIANSSVSPSNRGIQGQITDLFHLGRESIRVKSDSLADGCLTEPLAVAV